MQSSMKSNNGRYSDREASKQKFDLFLFGIWPIKDILIIGKDF